MRLIKRRGKSGNRARKRCSHSGAKCRVECEVVSEAEAFPVPAVLARSHESELDHGPLVDSVQLAPDQQIAMPALKQRPGSRRNIKRLPINARALGEAVFGVDRDQINAARPEKFADRVHHTVARGFGGFVVVVAEAGNQHRDFAVLGCAVDLPGATGEGHRRSTKHNQLRADRSGLKPGGQLLHNPQSREKTDRQHRRRNVRLLRGAFMEDGFPEDMDQEDEERIHTRRDQVQIDRALILFRFDERDCFRKWYCKNSLRAILALFDLARRTGIV